jgi:hypothetical protein
LSAAARRAGYWFKEIPLTYLHRIVCRDALRIAYTPKERWRAPVNSRRAMTGTGQSGRGVILLDLRQYVILME